MAKNVNKVARVLGAKVVGPVPDTGGGAFGAARLAMVVARLQSRLVPGEGKRPGRPSDPNWVRHPKVPMSEATERRLVSLAAGISSTAGRKISPMQLAAQILEEAVSALPEDEVPST